MTVHEAECLLESMDPFSDLVDQLDDRDWPTRRSFRPGRSARWPAA